MYPSPLQRSGDPGLGTWASGSPNWLAMGNVGVVGTAWRIRKWVLAWCGRGLILCWESRWLVHLHSALSYPASKELLPSPLFQGGDTVLRLGDLGDMAPVPML